LPERGDGSRRAGLDRTQRNAFPGCDFRIAEALEESRAERDLLDDRQRFERETEPLRLAPDVDSALRQARHLAGRDGVVVVCGSLYLAGEALGLLGL